MIVRLNKAEIAVLLLHMTITRKNVRNGFKHIGKTRHKEVMNSYDEIKNTLEVNIEHLEHIEEQEQVIFNFNINEINMINLFLNWYVASLKDLLIEAGKYVGEDERQVQLMHEIHSKVKKSIEIQHV